MQYFEGKRVWITGASSGIGRALTLHLARSGALCVLTARDVNALSRLKEDVEQLGSEALVAPGDVTSIPQMEGVVSDAVKKFGGIDILVANAGTCVYSDHRPFDSSEYLKLMDINFGGMVRCIEAVLPTMRRQGWGHIVGVASLAGFRGLPTAAAYGASKAAAAHFLESLRFHLREEGITVSVVNPGFVRTPLTDKNTFPMPFLMEASRAAEIMCSAIARKKRELSFPLAFTLFLKLMRIAPGTVYDFIVKRLWNRIR